MAGVSYADIARSGIGYNSPQAASQDVRRVLRNLKFESAEDVLLLDLGRLDEIQKLLTAALRSGDLSQSGPILRVMAFRRETLGMTAEVIAENMKETANQLVNNGIMVVQGTTGDYIEAMAKAAGASPEEIRGELDRIAGNSASGPDGSEQVSKNMKRQVNGEVVTSQLVELPLTDRDDSNEEKTELPPDLEILADRFSDFVETAEINDQQKEEIPSLQLDSPILEIDISENNPKKKVLRIKTKLPDSNEYETSGVPYNNPPRKPSDSVGEQVVRRKLRKPAKQSDQGKRFSAPRGARERQSELSDELETEILIQRIE